MFKNVWGLIFVVLSACSGQPSYLYKGTENGSRADIEAGSKPKGGYVRKPETAAKIAEVISSEFYGQDVIENQKPLLVTRSGDVWIVRGTFPYDSDTKGGVIEVMISSDSGAILGMIHGE